MPSHQARSCHSRFRILAGLGTLALLGCGDVAGPDDLQQVTGDVGSIAAPPAAGSTIAFQSFMDDVGAQASKESRTLIRTARGYQAFFGHAPPAAVDFSREWVMFYAAGTARTGGYEASFLAVLRVGRSLVAITRLESPGAGCVTTDALTTPYALIKFPAQGDASAQFFKQDSTRDCGASLCAAVTCPVGSDCDPMTGKCIGGSVQCGGIAGIACPGLGKCVDAPNDGCDPRMGADCGGICSCPQNVACDANSNFDSSPTVCACVLVKPPVCGPVCAIACQYGNVLDAKGCPTCACNPPPTVTCGGITGKTCPGAGKCVDDPNDSCDPARGGADCGGLCSCPQAVMCDPNSKFDSSPSVCACVPVKPVCGPVCEIFCQYGNVLDANGCPTCKCNPSPMDPCATVRCAAGTHCDGGKCLADGPSCGGIAGIQCPGLGKCVDHPLDSCLPSMGGADCGGICSCDQNAVACPPDRKFDGSPSVCACVPVTPPMCPPVCKIYCQYGNVLDAAGCPTCTCNPPPADSCAAVLCMTGTRCEAGKCVPNVPSCGPVCAIACQYGNVLDAAGCPTCKCNPAPTGMCPPEKCPTPAPASPSMICADGTTAGPVCALTADGVCGWAVTRCGVGTPTSP